MVGMLKVAERSKCASGLLARKTSAHSYLSLQSGKYDEERCAGRFSSKSVSLSALSSTNTDQTGYMEQQDCNGNGISKTGNVRGCHQQPEIVPYDIQSLVSFRDDDYARVLRKTAIYNDANDNEEGGRTVPFIRTHDEPFVRTDEDIRDALWNFVSKHRFYAKKPVMEMEILAIELYCAHRCTLETRVEQLQARWLTEPYKDKTPISTPQKQTCTQLSVDACESVKSCQTCVGRGVKPCIHCMCTGKARCPFCHSHNFHTNGIGHLQSQHCFHCSGYSYLPCPYCSGSGHITCARCLGTGKLRTYLRTKATMKTNVGEIIIKPPDFTGDKSESLHFHQLKSSHGTVVAEESSNGLLELRASLPSVSVSRAAADLLLQHGRAAESSTVKFQKLKVEAIPIARVTAEYGRTTKSFFIYGRERNVYFPGYFSKWPSCCASSCSIM